MLTPIVVVPVTAARVGAPHFEGFAMSCNTRLRSAAGRDSIRLAAPSGVFSASVKVAIVF